MGAVPTDRIWPDLAASGLAGSGDWYAGADIRVRMIKWQISTHARTSLAGLVLRVDVVRFR